MTRGLIVLVAAATMGAAVLPPSAQAGSNGGAVAAGVLGGWQSAPSWAPPRPLSRATRRRRFTLLRPRAAIGPAASRCGTVTAAPGCGRACRSATNSSATDTTGCASSWRLTHSKRPRDPRGRFFFGRGRVAPSRIPPIVRAQI